ncbi:AraC family transcriptional regulator [Paludibaculum fermentans]|uniref:AraC family transcriptional regulator n=1 Tax=Paludibaculum fermentans TaxID=1473598 RepID=A0A7S7SPL0_PALFE|nr:AraC family transcriptional regulator [Paludibaculum fermentans]QOY91716.1 AraC family transcriptional regulator [Paludibaculum fermentans]
MSKSPRKQTNRPAGRKLRRVIEVSGADVLTDVLNGLGLQSRLFCRSQLHAPWGMSFEKGDSAHFHWIDQGTCWLHCPGHLTEPRLLQSGDLVVLPYGDAYYLSDRPGGEAVPVLDLVGGGTTGRCRLLIQGGSGPLTSMLCGSFSFLRDGVPLLALLPAVLHLRGDTSGTRTHLEPVMRALVVESEDALPGWETVLTRLMDILFVRVIRAWLRDQPTDSHWLAALNDRQIHTALSLMHETPEHPWTLQTLSRKVGLSRSPFAARFTRLVGEPPLTYLTRLRMHRAARALRERKLTLAAAAQLAGYTSEIAFGKAFRRIIGVPPGAYRRSTTAQSGPSNPTVG